MPECKLLHKCRFFSEKMAKMPEAEERVKLYYCKNHFDRCARFVFRKVTGEMAGDLMPNEIEKVSDRLGWGLMKRK